jgi:hypothetical protein
MLPRETAIGCWESETKRGAGKTEGCFYAMDDHAVVLLSGVLRAASQDGTGMTACCQTLPELLNDFLHTPNMGPVKLIYLEDSHGVILACFQEKDDPYGILGYHWN